MSKTNKWVNQHKILFCCPSHTDLLYISTNSVVRCFVFIFLQSRSLGMRYNKECLFTVTGKFSYSCLNLNINYQFPILNFDKILLRRLYSIHKTNVIVSDGFIISFNNINIKLCRLAYMNLSLSFILYSVNEKQIVVWNRKKYW